MTKKIQYYEVSDGMEEKFGGKYFRHNDSRDDPSILKHSLEFYQPLQLLYASNRAWEWDPETDKVRYIKHRHTGIMTEVDLKEFAMIQIKAEQY